MCPARSLSTALRCAHPSLNPPARVGLVLSFPSTTTARGTTRTATSVARPSPSPPPRPPARRSSAACRRRSRGMPAPDSRPYHQEKKDKIGERVAALQQLVSPFGKVRHGFCPAGGVGVHQVPAPAAAGPELPLHARSSGRWRCAQDPQRYSLRSRGLCLVPVDLTLQLTQSNGADLWAPAHTARRR
ncbi:Transcription factor bHLH68 [Zea mays]|uniref:Transcription factor bHLH68 n=1 Tax=Zea mays TaxID=4577 RepID=A0A1D6J9A6_MAIZE|nr:Transcription factor bHLH68 [Zea mays]